MEEAAGNLRDHLLIHLLFHLGCRVSEALALKIEDVDLENSSVTIVHLKHRVSLFCPDCRARLARAHQFCPACGKPVAEVSKKALERRRMRTLPLAADTVGMLRAYIESGGPMFRNGVKSVFGINRHRAWQIVRECADKAGLPRLTNP